MINRCFFALQIYKNECFNFVECCIDCLLNGTFAIYLKKRVRILIFCLIMLDNYIKDKSHITVDLTTSDMAFYEIALRDFI